MAGRADLRETRRRHERHVWEVVKRFQDAPLILAELLSEPHMRCPALGDRIP